MVGFLDVRYLEEEGFVVFTAFFAIRILLRCSLTNTRVYISTLR